jgi:hypothetical protein
MTQPKTGLLNKYLRFLFAAFIFTSFLFIGQPAKADISAGLTQDVYTYTEGATPDKIEYTLCNTGVVSNINWDVGNDIVANCQNDFVLIHWHGYITLPVDGEVTFQSIADDGFYLDIGGSPVIDNWTLKGCSGGTGTHVFESGVSQKVDIWWYEYGGGACNFLYYTDLSTFYNLVPDSIWTTEEVAVVIPPVIVDPPVIIDPPVEPPVVEPPVVEPPVVVPPVDPPVEPPIVIPPVDPPVEPPIVIPPVEPPVDPVIPNPPLTPEPPIAAPVAPIETVDPIVEIPIEVPTAQESLATLVDIQPSELTDVQVEQLQEVAYAVLKTAEQGSPEYEQALEALFVAAQADDIIIDEELANTPVIGAAIVAFADAINFLGNIGADISPKVREETQKVVVGAIVVGQIAGTASLSAMKRTGK